MSVALYKSILEGAQRPKDLVVGRQSSTAPSDASSLAGSLLQQGFTSVPHEK
ncbi:MAG: hypothetical protein FWF18_03075 [Dehalococcoidia bacterium]|nr:hypothetical protein [Dehalococcoidia bacterium]